MKVELKNMLQDLANKLPVKWTQTGFEEVSISEEDIKLSGFKSCEPGIEYMIKVPIVHQVNHFERIKTAFKRNGLEGVKKYANSQI